MKYTSKLILNWTEYEFGAGGGWYQPNANTILYLPIDNNDTSSTVYDHSTNQTDFNWYWTANYDTLASWKKVLNLTWSNWIYIDSALFTSWPATVNLWLYRDGDQGSDTWVFTLQHWGPDTWFIITFFDNTYLTSFLGTGGSWVWLNNRENTANQTWIQATTTYENWIMKMYINWILKQTFSWNMSFNQIQATSLGFSRYVENTIQNTRFLIWKMWSIIVEDKARTEQEISDYFDQTKSLYWIS